MQAHLPALDHRAMNAARTAMTIRHLPVVGCPINPPTPRRKIAIEEHFIDPTRVHPNYGDSFSGEDDQKGSRYAGFNPPNSPG